MSAEPRSKEEGGSPGGLGPPQSRQLWPPKGSRSKGCIVLFFFLWDSRIRMRERGIWAGTWFTFQIESLIDSDLSLFTFHYPQEPLSSFYVPGDPDLSLTSKTLG